VEARCNAARGRAGHRARTGAARAHLRAGAARGVVGWRNRMNVLPALKGILDELRQRFGAQIEHAHAPPPNRLYLHTRLELAGALCSVFYKRYNGRVAGVFAGDARGKHNVFLVYYLYALDSAHGFVLVRVPVPKEQPEMPSLTNAIHA